MELQGKRVLVTGADGFIGSHLIEALLVAGLRRQGVRLLQLLQLVGLARHRCPPRRSRRSRSSLATSATRTACARRSPASDVVFHLAALIGIPFSYHSPDSYVDTNISGTLNVLQAVRDLGIERVVVTSTSEVYGTAQYVPIDEKHPLQGQSPYSASKIGADKMAESFHRSFGPPVVTARPFNTYGPRQSARAVIPTIITQLLAGRERIELGSLTPTRDLTYVTDTCAGFLALAGATTPSGATSTSAPARRSPSATSRSSSASSRACPSRSSSTEERLRPEASEVERLLADNTLIRELTGWEPRSRSREGLAQTIEWFSDDSEPRALQARHLQRLADRANGVES